MLRSWMKHNPPLVVLARLETKISLEHVIIIALAAATCLFALPLAGCSSSRSGMTNIYLTSLSYQRSPTGSNSAVPSSLNSTFSLLVGDASMTIRAGYFGVCIRSSPQDWTCHKDGNSFATMVNITQDPLNLVSNSIVFKERTVFSGLIFISFALGVVCILLATFLFRAAGVHGRGDMGLKPLTRALCGILSAAVLFALLSSFWQHIAAVAFTTTARNMAYGSVKSEVGTITIGLGWASVAFYIVALLAALLMRHGLPFWTRVDLFNGRLSVQED